MLRWFAIFFALGVGAGLATGAPAGGAKPKKEPPAEDKKKEAATDTHKVRRGDTLWGIARLHGVSVGDLMDLNHLSDSTLREGQTLKIPRPGSDPALAPAKATTYTVAKGETFRGIARKFGLTQDDLERANPKIDPDRPKAGSKLTIPATVSTPEKTRSESGKTEPAPGISHTVTEENAKPKTRHYIVSADETPQTISEAFNISVAKLYEMNGLKPGSPMRPGMEIQVPGLPVGRAE